VWCTPGATGVYTDVQRCTRVYTRVHPCNTRVAPPTRPGYTTRPWAHLRPWAQDGPGGSPSPGPWPASGWPPFGLTFAHGLRMAQKGPFLPEIGQKRAVLARKRSKTARFGPKSAQNSLFSSTPLRWMPEKRVFWGPQTPKHGLGTPSPRAQDGPGAHLRPLGSGWPYLAHLRPLGSGWPDSLFLSRKRAKKGRFCPKTGQKRPKRAQKCPF